MDTTTELRECPNGCGLRAPASQLPAVHWVLGTRDRCAYIIIYRQTYMPDDVVDGDINAPVDQELVKLDSDFGYEPFPIQAAMVLEHEGLTEYSATQYQTHAHAWYCHPDGSTVSGSHGNYTGEREIATAHLYGFTEAERREVFELVGLIP